MQATQYLYRKQRQLILWVVILGLGYWLIADGLQFQFQTLLQIGPGLVWLSDNFWPKGLSITDWWHILNALWRMVMIAIAATTCAATVALGLAVFGAENFDFPKIMRVVIRGFASILRNIPVVVWAMILLFAFKQNDLTGFLALFLMSLGFLTRAFMETLEDLGTKKMQALAVTGATRTQIFTQGVLPEIANTLLGWLLYMIENNVRDATLVGLLTGTGIGFIFDLYFKSLRYGAAGAVIVVIAGGVLVIELASLQLRRWLR